MFDLLKKHFGSLWDWGYDAKQHYSKIIR
jgi:hypothetical protein